MSQAESLLEVYRFSFEEHEWIADCEDPDQASEQMLERARTGGWTVAEPDEHRWLDSELSTLPALREALTAALSDELEQPPEIAAALFENLEHFVRARGTFLCGGFLTVESHHNDTLVFVQLAATPLA